MDYLQLLTYLTEKAKAEEEDEKFQEQRRKLKKGKQYVAKNKGYSGSYDHL